MVDTKTKLKPKKGMITERIVSKMLSRYSPNTLLNLLVEVNQVGEAKVDWNALVRKTSTGISNAREYQMLWRHLAYQDPILETIEDGAQPLDDDSDLEYELEVHPPVSSEATAEAAACVKVLIASGLQGGSSLPSGMTVEAPLVINIPNCQLEGEASGNEQHLGTNIAIPVSVQKQNHSVPTTVQLTEGLDNKKRRIPWTPAEDAELIAAVQKYGIGNWANIVKCDIMGERTASQLSQRWSIIRRRKGVLNKGILINSGAPQASDSNLLATRNAVSLALNMPMDRLKASASSNNAVMYNVPSGQSSQQDKGPATATPMPKSRLGPTITAPIDPLKAAAVAAGARIASSQGKPAVIVPRLGLPPNVHFMRTGLVTAPIASSVQQRSLPPLPPPKQPQPPQQPQPQISDDEEDDSIFDIFKSEASLAKKKQNNPQVIEQRKDQSNLLKDNGNQNQLKGKIHGDDKEKADVEMTERIEDEQKLDLGR